MMISIPPKYAVSQVVGLIKGKSAIHLAGHTERGSATSWDSISGPEATSSRP
jgi:REP element-mobilizing transposase RayT